ncbi:Hypothetical protein, putative [Bodo saltans]|uniref:Uncharacterized protein n=1 Tax=Bodo saltans TaxID=75058 RepID=A0A0S4IYI7_BODSA|nr:Hypothetical protein, putative [Bodo saltans]|eukprot:CUG19183.1 Hypothetical protein, putative [Bodo saltans]
MTRNICASLGSALVKSDYFYAFLFVFRAHPFFTVSRFDHKKKKKSKDRIAQQNSMPAVTPGAWTNVSYQRPHSAAPSPSFSSHNLLTPSSALPAEGGGLSAADASPITALRRAHTTVSSATAAADGSTEMVVYPYHRPRSADVMCKSSNTMDTWVLKCQLHKLTQPFASHFLWKRRECVDEELSVRYTIVHEMLESAGFLMSTLTALEEAACFHEICAQRKDEAFMPWCSQGCRYCCTHRLLWADHATQLWMSLRIDLQQQETVVRRSLEAGLLHELNGLHNYFQANARAHDLLLAHQSTLEAEWQHVTTIVKLNEDRCFQTELMEVKDRMLSEWKAECNRIALVNRERDADRQAESAAVSFGRAAAQTSFCMREHEVERRRTLVQRELNERIDLRARMEAQGTLISQQLWRVANDDTFEELKSLRQFKMDVEAAQRKAEEDRVAAIRAEWAKELQEIKKLKKSGPPKGQQALPSCGRCGQPPAKDEFTHRIQECVERPVACPKCTEVMPFSRLEAHKSVCSQRIVQCGSCLHYYKASYLEGAHKVYCAALPEMSRLLKSTSGTEQQQQQRSSNLWKWLPTLPINAMLPGSLELPWSFVQTLATTTTSVALPPTTAASSTVTMPIAVPFMTPIVSRGSDESCGLLTHIGAVAVNSWAQVQSALDELLRTTAATSSPSMVVASLSVEEILSTLSPVNVICSFATTTSSSAPQSLPTATENDNDEGSPPKILVATMPVVPALTSTTMPSSPCNNTEHSSDCVTCSFCQLQCHQPSQARSPEYAAVDLLKNSIGTGSGGSEHAGLLHYLCQHHVRWMYSVHSSDIAQYCKPAIERKGKKR